MRAPRSYLRQGRAKHRATSQRRSIMPDVAKSGPPAQGRLAIAATWEAKEQETDTIAEILRKMTEAVKSEPGTLLFWPHRSSSNDRVFFLYELFADDAAFAAHQQTAHFKD